MCMCEGVCRVGPATWFQSPLKEGLCWVLYLWRLRGVLIFLGGCSFPGVLSSFSASVVSCPNFRRVLEEAFGRLSWPKRAPCSQNHFLSSSSDGAGLGFMVSIGFEKLYIRLQEFLHSHISDFLIWWEGLLKWLAQYPSHSFSTEEWECMPLLNCKT